MPYSLPLEPRPPKCTVPLTAVQRVYWRAVAHLNTGRNSFRNPAATLRILGPLDIRCLEQCIQSVIDRHEPLRTRIAHFDLDQEPTQLIDTRRPFQLQVVDLSNSASGAIEDTARRLGKEFLSEGFDLTRGPVFDAKIFKLSGSDHLLILTLDHMVSDGTSYPLLTNEIISPLKNGHQRAHESLPEMRIQFPDYAVWQHKTQESWRQQHQAYWEAKLGKFSPLLVPTDHPAPDQTPSLHSVVHAPLGKKLTDALRDLARREHCLMPIVVLSLYLIVMSRFCDRRDLLVNFLSHGRHGHPELRDMIGCIAHSVLLRIEITPSDSLRDFVSRVTSEVHTSLSHDASRVVATHMTPDSQTEIHFNWLPTDWGLSGTYPSALRQVEQSDLELMIRHFPIDKQIPAKFTPNFSDTPSGILTVLWYSADLFLRSTVERFVDDLRAIVEIFVRNQHTTIASLDLRK